ncbi:MAG: TetR/AcrR family transcriptional regulator [Sulfurospirillaceae bacterium]|nr:TetR/AcrR family transcriptional regulator [Sulfurospirillaceae bacterium]MDD2825955.1 TetR/AcrR family transcriptional regulator [Sulfurospirillaceae bacterium]
MARIIDKEEKRSEIARSAIDLFSQKGIVQTSMDEIAKSAGVAKGTIYLYFKNKEEIMFAVWDMLSQQHDEAYAKRIRSDMSAREKILGFFDFTECEKEHDKEQMLTLYQHFVSSMLVDKTGLYTAYFESFFEKDHAFISGCLHEGIKKGEFYINNVDLLSHTIIILLKGVLVKAKASNMSFYEAQQTLMQHIIYLLEQCTRKP